METSQHLHGYWLPSKFQRHSHSRAQAMLFCSYALAPAKAGFIADPSARGKKKRRGNYSVYQLQDASKITPQATKKKREINWGESS
jgi:hypothetical protein